jgi:hypothetical protein
MGLFGPEKILLHLEKFDYKAGETIKGTVKLQLKKPLNARKLEVGLVGRKIEQQSGIRIGISPGSPKTGYQKSTQYSTVYDFQLPLCGEQEYLEGEFPFEIKIPDGLLDNMSSQGNVATAINVLKTISGVSSRVEWMVVARLDVPLKLDVSASQKIILS